MRLIKAISLAILLAGSVLLAADREPVSPVKEDQPVRIEPTGTGYKMYLNRMAAEQLQKALNLTEGNEGAISDALKDLSKNSTNDDVKNTLGFWALAMKEQSADFRKAVNNKMGPDGLVITVIGIEKKKDRPVLKKIGEFLPAEIQDKAKNALKVLRTTPLLWSVEPLPLAKK